MAKFLTTAGISLYIDEIINSAEQSIYLISPFLKFSELLVQRLNDAHKKGKKITIIFGKNEHTKSQRDIISNLKTDQIFSCPNLYTNCYANENRIVVTSMHINDYSIQNNPDKGILIDRTIDPELFYDTLKEIDVIKNSSREKKSCFMKTAEMEKNKLQIKPNTTTDSFHLPLIKSYLKLKYPRAKYFENNYNHTIELKDFPKPNISISINKRIDVCFQLQYEYNDVELWRDQFENQFPGNTKISWDNKKISIYRPADCVKKSHSRPEHTGIEFYYHTLKELADFF